MKTMVLKKEKNNDRRLDTTATATDKVSVIQKFMKYAGQQERNRFGWLAFALFFQGCVLSPITVWAIYENGNSFALWIPCIAAFAATETVLLAAMPTKITIPVIFTGILIDVIVIILSFII